MSRFGFRAASSKPAPAAAIAGLVGCMSGDPFYAQPFDPGGLPPPPCARDRGVMTGQISALGGGCVSVVVDYVEHGGSPLVNDAAQVIYRGGPESVGSTFRGRLSKIHAYDHPFAIGEEVVALIGPWEQGLELELLPFVDERAQVEWAGERLEMSLSEISYAACDAVLLTARQERGAAVSPGANQQPTEPAPADKSCALP